MAKKYVLKIYKESEKMKKIMLMLMVVVLAACNKEEKISVEFMTGTAVDTDLFREYEKITKKFMELNEGVVVELIPSSTDHEGEIKSRLGSKNPPDMWMTHGWSLKRYRDFLVDLSDQPWADDLNPALKKVMISDKGNIYAFPIDTDVAGILYNEDVLQSVGIDVSKINSWDDFMDASMKVKAKGITPIYNAGKDKWPTGLYVDWILPGYLTKQDYNDFTHGIFKREKYKKVLEKIEEFRESGFFNMDYSSTTSDDISRALAQGNTAFSFMMNFVATASYLYNDAAKIGFMPVPNDHGEPYYISGEKNAIGISKDSKHMDLCKKYLKYLAEKENLKILASATGSAAGLKNIDVDLKGLSASWKNVEKGKSEPYFDRVYMPSGSWDSIVATAEGVLTGQMTIEEALIKIESDFNSLYK